MESSWLNGDFENFKRLLKQKTGITVYQNDKLTCLRSLEINSDRYRFKAKPD